MLNIKEMKYLEVMSRLIEMTFKALDKQKLFIN